MKNEDSDRFTVEESFQKDVGKGIVRFDFNVFSKYGFKQGDIVGLAGKRKISAILCLAHQSDKGKRIIRMDGFLRKNAGVTKNQTISLFIPRIESAAGIIIAPIDMRLNVDEGFTDFCKKRLESRVITQGDTALIMMLGHAIPFKIVRVTPNLDKCDSVKVTEKSKLLVLTDPYDETDSQIFVSDLKFLLRNDWLHSVVPRLKVVKTTFKIVGSEFETEKEESIIEDAQNTALDNFSAQQVSVNFYGSTGLIGSLPWISVDVFGRAKAIYPDVQIPTYFPMQGQNYDSERSTSFIDRCFKMGLSTCPKSISFSPKRVFIAMPFNSHNQDMYKFAIRPALEDQKLEIWKADEQINNIDIMCKICQAIQESAYVIAEISEWNANVLFEMGLAYGMAKSVVILKDRKSNVPVDLKGLEFIEYESIDELKRNLSSFFGITLQKSSMSSCHQ